MDKFDRIFHLHAILSARRTPIPLEDLMARLECSKSTLHRTINALKDYLNAPVVFDANAGGYRYSRQEQGDEAYELLWIEYHARSTDQQSERTISPQRITHYRETWYLDAWDEERNALRIFSVDRIVRATVLDAPAFDVAEKELDEHYASAYGIFGGKADKTAVLRFTRDGARWIADEKWHPQQEATWLPDGRYELRIPYREPRELVMDIMRQGKNVEVVAPDELREQVRRELHDALSQYSKRLQGSA